MSNMIIMKPIVLLKDDNLKMNKQKPLEQYSLKTSQASGKKNITKKLTRYAECTNRYLGLRGWLAGWSFCLNVTGRLCGH